MANIPQASLDCSATLTTPTSSRAIYTYLRVRTHWRANRVKLVKAGDVVVCFGRCHNQHGIRCSSSFIVVEGSRNGLVVLYTDEVDLKLFAIQPSPFLQNLYCCSNRSLLVLTDADTVTGQPTIRFGNSSDRAVLKAAAATSGLTANGDRHRVTTFHTNDAQDSTYDLSAGVTVAATGTTVKGRFGFVGYYLPV